MNDALTQCPCYLWVGFQPNAELGFSQNHEVHGTSEGVRYNVLRINVTLKVVENFGLVKLVFLQGPEFDVVGAFSNHVEGERLKNLPKIDRLVAIA